MSDIEYIVLGFLYQALCQHKMAHGETQDVEDAKRIVLDAIPIDPPDGWIWGMGRRFRYLPKASEAQTRAD